MDPFSGLATFILGRLKQSAISLWLKLLFELGFSATVSFLLTCGTTLVSTRSATLAIGSGMIVASVAMTLVFRKTKLTKGLTVVLPQAELDAESGNQMQVIEKK
ncbi:MAG: hypothetical protein CXZ00_02995 [Acidobacteria bacterium]|nr:MAG: hypothetical protein CXZ00_02995 [Acidobacteriota bacterium]